jgi:CRISPR-associated protein (TIGR03984 family)
MNKIKISEKDHELDYSSNHAFMESLPKITGIYKLKYGLLHHEDGIIWGKFEEVGWELSEGIAPSPKFDLLTLLQARFFGEAAELFLWKVANRLESRLLVEGYGGYYEYFDQEQILWGDTPEPSTTTFTRMIEGAQGLEHLVPMKNVKPRVGLTIRSYVDYDNQSQAYIRWHRLVELTDNIQPQTLGST